MARVDAETVLRCHNPETDWYWYYDCDADGTAIRYHERDGFAPTPTVRTIVAETVAMEAVETAYLSRTHLDILRGDGRE